MPKITGWPGAGHSSAGQPNSTATSKLDSGSRRLHSRTSAARSLAGVERVGPRQRARGRRAAAPLSPAAEPHQFSAESSAHLAQVKGMQQVCACPGRSAAKQVSRRKAGLSKAGRSLQVAGRHGPGPGISQGRAAGPHSYDNPDQDHRASVRWQSGTTIRPEPAEPRVDS